MVRRIGAVLLALMLLIPAAAGAAGMKWLETTPALKTLKAYTENVNAVLTEEGEKPINRMFSCYPTQVVMGITEEDDAEIPEGVEVTVEMYADSSAIKTLQLRVNDPERFKAIAGAFIKALYGENETQEQVMRATAERAEKAQDNPGDSFEEEVDEGSGNVPQFFYAYYPNAYLTGVNWIQMTIVFPITDEWDGSGAMLISDEETQEIDPDGDPDYEGYFSKDDYTHLEVFSTPTPEPDSAAVEYDFR